MKQSINTTVEKQVFRISVNGQFKQFLMKSESRFLKDMCESWGKVTIELVNISLDRYNLEFGKK